MKLTCTPENDCFCDCHRNLLAEELAAISGLETMDLRA